MTRWRVHGERAAYQSDWVSVGLADVELPDGRRFDHHTIRTPAPAAGVVVHDPDRGVLLIWRHRFIPDTWGWEIPAGRLDPGETPEQGATRETLEETGWRPGPLHYLCEMTPMSGVADTRFILFGADGAELVGDPVDAHEAERVEWVPLSEVRALMACGEMTDGMSLVGVLWAIAFGALGRHAIVDAVETIEPVEPVEAADANEIRAGIQARREQRRSRRRHRTFVAVALVAAALITLVAYQVTSSDKDEHSQGASVRAGSRPPITDSTTTVAAAPAGDFQPSPGAVQWIDAPAEEPAAGPRPTAAPGTRPCTAFQISAKGSWQPNGGALVGGVRFTNHSATPCSLHGVPEVRLTDANGRRLSFGQQSSGTPDSGPALMPPRAQDAAAIGLQWVNWCAPLNQPVKVRINLPDNGNVIDVDADGDGFKGVPDCSTQGGASTMTVDPFQAAASPVAPAPSAGLVATVRSPASVVAGSTLHYEVTLKNSTSAPIPLQPCPSYSESVASARARYRLNCEPVGQIGPGASVIFSMQLPVPADTPLGPATLQWEAGGPATSAGITVTAA